MKSFSDKKRSTSWEPAAQWYKKIVGAEGHYYHKQVIIPGVLRMLESQESLLDLACGNGILSRYLPAETEYQGIDIAPSLIKEAKQTAISKAHSFQVGDITKPFSLPNKNYASAACILSAQNLKEPERAFHNAFAHLRKGGVFIVVINHPCFRIPRQSSWQVDEEKKIQYRRIDRYMTSMEVPIQTHPGKGTELATLSFHH